MKNIQEEIYIDNKEVDVFDKKSLDEITITDKKVKAWIVQIYYNDNNQDMVKNILTKNGYNLKHNKKKSFSQLDHSQRCPMLRKNQKTQKCIRS